MLRVTNKIINSSVRRAANSDSTSSANVLKYYAKTGGKCLALSGAAIWLFFFPATQTVSYFGGATLITDKLIKYDVTRGFVEKSRKLGREQAPSFLGERFLEVFITGFSLYFCLKPVRYPLWFYLTRKCIQHKQDAAMKLARQELIRKKRQKFKVGHGYIKKWKPRIKQ